MRRCAAVHRKNGRRRDRIPLLCVVHSHVFNDDVTHGQTAARTVIYASFYVDDGCAAHLINVGVFDRQISGNDEVTAVFRISNGYERGSVGREAVSVPAGNFDASGDVQRALRRVAVNVDGRAVVEGGRNDDGAVFFGGIEREGRAGTSDQVDRSDRTLCDRIDLVNEIVFSDGLRRLRRGKGGDERERQRQKRMFFQNLAAKGTCKKELMRYRSACRRWGGGAIRDLRMIYWIVGEKKPICDDNPSLRRSGVQHAPPHCAGKSVVGGENPANLHGLFALECNETETFPFVRREVPTPFSHACCGKVRKCNRPSP